MKLSKKHILAGAALFLLLCSSLLVLPRALSPSGSSADEAFAAFTRELFQNEIASNTLTLHYTLSDPEALGIPDAPVSFGPYSSSNAEASAATLENYLETLSSFSYRELSPENQLTYDICEVQLQRELEAVPYRMYEEIFSPTLGVQAQLPVLLAEYAFRQEQDVKDYLELLSQLDTYYASLMEFQREKSDAGLFMSDTTADAVIAQCRDFISNPSENFLLSTFDERLEALDGLSKEQILSYSDANRAVVFGHVIPAYELLIDGLTKLKGTGTNPLGLCYYEQGREYYESLIACTIGSGRSVEEIKLLLEEQMQLDLETMAEIISDHPEILKTTSQSIDTYEPRFILETLEQKIQADFPAVSQASYDIKYVDPSLEKYLSPAFYLTPPLDRMNDHVIYINPAGNYDGLSLFTTLAHEGYPGHLYQTIYENSCRPDPVRNLFYFGGYVEGWATYAEQYAYSYSSLDPDMAALLAANNEISLGLYANADIGIHYDGWTLEATAAYLSGYGITNAASVEAIYQAIVEDPANYLKYYLGSVEIQKLKEQANAALLDAFVLKDFHDFLLSIGPAPFPVIEAYMEKWLDSIPT